MAKPKISEYSVNVDGDLKPFSSCGHIMMHETLFLPPYGKFGYVIVFEYKMTGNIIRTDAVHANNETIFDMKGVRRRGDVIG